MAKTKSSEKSDNFSDQAHRLRLVRADLRLTQHEMAERAGLTIDTYGRAERGANLIPTEMLNTLAAKCRISPTWLLTGEGEMYIEEGGPTVPKDEGQLAMEQARFEAAGEAPPGRTQTIHLEMAGLRITIRVEPAPLKGG